MNNDDARNSESAETVSTLVHKILLAQADLVDVEAAARHDKRLRPAASRARAKVADMLTQLAILRGETPPPPPPPDGKLQLGL